jgi:hypothetical protein
MDNVEKEYHFPPRSDVPQLCTDKLTCTKSAKFEKEALMTKHKEGYVAIHEHLGHDRQLPHAFLYKSDKDARADVDRFTKEGRLVYIRGEVIIEREGEQYLAGGLLL